MSAISSVRISGLAHSVISVALSTCWKIKLTELNPERLMRMKEDVVYEFVL